MRIKVYCLSCGHPMELSDAYEDYAGEVRCWGCRAVMEIALSEGKLRSMKQSAGAPESGLVDAGAAEQEAR